MPYQEPLDRSGEQSSSRLPGRLADSYDDHDDIRDPLDEWVRWRALPHHPRPPGMQHAVGSMPMWYSPSQSYHPVFNPMHHVNEAPWMVPNYATNSSSVMTYSRCPHPPYHYHQPQYDPVPDFSQLMLQLPQRNNTPEPATTSNNQQPPATCDSPIAVTSTDAVHSPTQPSNTADRPASTDATYFSPQLLHERPSRTAAAQPTSSPKSAAPTGSTAIQSARIAHGPAYPIRAKPFELPSQSAKPA